jgi:MFS transporter, Spinster family, sphingosine-1-phosphate transporter
MTRSVIASIRSWTPTQIYSLGLLILLNLSNYLDRTIVGILQQPMKDELRLEDWHLGVISGPAFALFYSLAGVPIARLAERVNRVTLISCALAIWSAMTALCGAAASFAHLVLARIGVGAAEGACTPCSHALVSDIFPPRQRGFAMSLLTTSIPIAQLLAPIIGGYVAMTWGWRAAFAVVGLPGVVLAAVIFFTMKEPREQPGSTHVRTHSSFFADMKLLLGNRAFVWLFVASAFMGQSITSFGSTSCRSLKWARSSASVLVLPDWLGRFLGACWPIAMRGNTAARIRSFAAWGHCSRAYSSPSCLRGTRGTSRCRSCCSRTFPRT